MRKALDFDSRTMIERYLSVSADCAVISDSLSTVAPATVARPLRIKRIVTVPFVAYGLYRYIHPRRRERRPESRRLCVGSGRAALTARIRI